MAFLLGECLLLEILNEKGMSQAEFARRMDCSRQYVSQLISGDATMSLQFAINASFLLDCDYRRFYRLIHSRSRKG
jgi:transcriptional regulator with XRE-family HTH domain